MVAPASRTQVAAPLLVVEGLSVEYGDGLTRIRALDSASLTVRSGEVVALVGPNGSGKTTLIHAIAGAVKPTSGHVLLKDRDVATMRPGDLARIASVLPQEPRLPAAFSALECVVMGRTPYLGLLQTERSEDFDIVRNAMVATDTWRFAGRLMGQLSGGERQRVILARSLAQETPVLLLDEPTAHLDVGQQAMTLALVQREARRSGKAVLAVVHDLTLAGQCDRVVVLSEGKVIADGPPKDVIRRELLSAVYGLDAHILLHPDTGDPVVAPSFRRA